MQVSNSDCEQVLCQQVLASTALAGWQLRHLTAGAVETHASCHCQPSCSTQGEAKQPAAGTTSATGLIAAFRPVEELPASSAAPSSPSSPSSHSILAPSSPSSPASTAGSNASDRQAAGDLQEIEFKSHLHALLLRAKVLRLEWSAHTPEDGREKENAGTSICPSTFALLLQC